MNALSSSYFVAAWFLSYIFPLSILISLFYPLLSWWGTWAFLICLVGDSLWEKQFFSEENSILWSSRQIKILKWIPRGYMILLWIALIAVFFSNLHEWSWIPKIGLWMNVVWATAFGVDKAHENLHKDVSKKNWIDKICSWHTYAILVQNHIFIHHNPLWTAKVEDEAACSSLNETYYAFLLKSPLLKKVKIFLENLSPVILALIFLILGWSLAQSLRFTFILSAMIMGTFLGATPLYAQHYGLKRQDLKTSECFIPHELTWECTHAISHFAFLNFPCHIQHHEDGSIPFYELIHVHEDPRELLPIGYFLTMIIVPFSSVWFYIMNPRVKSRMNLKKSFETK